MKSLARQNELDMIMIDYLQLMETKAQSREQEIAKITRTLKIMAMELNIPIILLSQLNRDCEKRQNKRPRLSDLRESGSIEQDANIVMFLYRDAVHSLDETDDSAEIIIAKSRESETGVAKMHYKAETTTFYEKDWHETNDYTPHERG